MSELQTELAKPPGVHTGSRLDLLNRIPAVMSINAGSEFWQNFWLRICRPTGYSIALHFLAKLEKPN
ncbi:MAG: hypothetical protein QOD75_3634 [Blastocatellia bacterium]|jgi:hypothetical protein|nr:hypothetical protein [Blastocatellia bacterium]